MDGVVSTKKRAPPLIVDDAVREGTYLAVLSVLSNTSVHKASQLTNVPESTIRDIVGRYGATGSVAPGKRGRKEVGGYSQMNRLKDSRITSTGIQKWH